MDSLFILLSVFLGLTLVVTLFLKKSQEQKFEILKASGEAFLKLAEAKFEKFHEKAKNELDKKEEGIEELLKPVKESFEKFETKIGELEKARIGAYSSIKEQVSMLLDAQKSLRNETSNLAKSLRTPNVRGRWGEIQLKRVVELSGMLAHCDFFEQSHTISDEGKMLRPDLVIKLPGLRNIVIDAKAPLGAYLEAIDAPTEEVRRLKMKEHAKGIRTHMSLLGRKNYWDQFHPTPEFVVLFLPAETFFSAALEEDPALIETGVGDKVILATPTTLIALLKSIAYGWRQESISKSAEEISALGKELYKRINDMSLHWSKMGRSLESAVEAYNKATGSLESRVLSSARKFNELQAGEQGHEIEFLEPIEKAPRVHHSSVLQTLPHSMSEGDSRHSSPDEV